MFAYSDNKEAVDSSMDWVSINGVLEEVQNKRTAELWSSELEKEEVIWVLFAAS